MLNHQIHLWVILKEVLMNFTKIHMCSELTLLKVPPYLPGAKELSFIQFLIPWWTYPQSTSDTWPCDYEKEEINPIEIAESLQLKIPWFKYQQSHFTTMPSVWNYLSRNKQNFLQSCGIFFHLGQNMGCPMWLEDMMHGGTFEITTLYIKTQLHCPKSNWYIPPQAVWLGLKYTCILSK